jgi:predicted  nucleic acid-binding Zn-ribbon protein
MSQDELATAFKEKEANRLKQDFYRFQTRENKVNRKCIRLNAAPANFS